MMKLPADLAEKLSRQWQQTELRLERLLSEAAWPVELMIGKPSGEQFARHTAEVRQQVQAWQAVTVGEVIFTAVKYRAAADAVELPLCWRLHTPTEWVAATENGQVQQEFRILEQLVFSGRVRQVYHAALIRERSLWRNKPVEDVITTASLADSLSPGAAQGRPLRLMAGFGVDTKFMERNAKLLQRLLDERYNGTASEQGLHAFLDAAVESDHWLLVKPLTSGLLPFKRLRLSTRELADTPLPCRRILVIENERCEHLLPELDAIAILGAGLDLGWLASPVFDGKQILYWGDMDSWGLTMLARARQLRPAIGSVLMDQATFEAFHVGAAVVELAPAGEQIPNGLTTAEQQFYLYLLNSPKGRLEQEFVPASRVADALNNWIKHQLTNNR